MLEPAIIDGSKKFTNEQVVELNQTLSPEEVKHRFRLSKKDLANYKARVIKLRRRGVPLRRWTVIAPKVDVAALTKLARRVDAKNQRYEILRGFEARTRLARRVDAKNQK